MSLKLYVFPPSPRGFKILFAAHHLGLDYELRLVDLTKGDQKAPAFLALNPNGRMPVLDDDGFVLWESNAIVEYLAAKAAGILSFGLLRTVADYADLAGIEKSAREARAFGFDGASCVHPSVVPILNRVFTPLRLR